MRYNGINPKTLAGCIGIKRETLPAKSREAEPLETSTGKVLGYISEETAVYTLEVNINGRNKEEAGEAWLKLAAWAEGDGGLQKLEPDRLRMKAYDAAFESITPMEGNARAGTCKITWLVPDTHPYSTIESRMSGSGGTVAVWNGGTRSSDLRIEIIPTTAKSGLTISMDGAAFFKMRGAIPAKARVVVDLAREVVTVDGDDRTADVDWQTTDYTRQLPPGRHTISTSAGGSITARWRDRWG